MSFLNPPLLTNSVHERVALSVLKLLASLCWIHAISLTYCKLLHDINKVFCSDYLIQQRIVSVGTDDLLITYDCSLSPCIFHAGFRSRFLGRLGSIFCMAA